MVELFTKRDLIKLLQHRLVKPFADAVSLSASGFGPGVIDVLKRHVELELVMLSCPTELGASVGKNSQQPNSFLFEDPVRFGL